jgi:uncharacterized membrane protein YphA (DoxX/SURF4 family)
VQIALGGIFAYAAVGKLRDPRAFADSVATFELLAPLGISAVAAMLPMIELVSAVMLLSGWHRRPAALLVGMLAALFVVAAGSAAVRGLKIDCGCFGASAEGGESPLAVMLRAALLSLAAFWTWRWEVRLPMRSARAGEHREILTQAADEL